MQPEQQRILGYFIEEAKEHLQTIESALLNLQSVVQDQEHLNEVFRAAHSVKGGAAMLGITSMQHIAHRLEDYFKVLKEHPVEVDAKLESLFFKGFDALNSLTTQLETTLELPESMEQQILQEVEPVFAQLQTHLIARVGPEADLSELLSAGEPLAAPKSEPVVSADPEAVDAFFRREVMEKLRQALQLFQSSNPQEAGAALVEICQHFAQVGQSFQLSSWQSLAETAALATEANQDFGRLAPILIKEFKTARDALLADPSAQVTPSRDLQDLLPKPPEATEDWLGLFEEAPASADGLDFLFDEPTQEVVPGLGLEALEVKYQPLSATEIATLSALLAEPQPMPAVAAPLPTAAPVLPDPPVEKPEPKVPAVARSTARAGRRGTNPTMKVAVKQLDNLSNLIGELVVNRNTLEDNQDRLRQFLGNLQYQVSQLNELGQKMQDLYERSLLESSLVATPSGGVSGAGNMAVAYEDGNGRHATGVQFDALEMDRFTGFHTLSQEMIERIVRVREAAADIEFIVDANEQVSRTFRQVTTQVQEGFTRTRMVPFSQGAERLPRAVRDISIKCGKQAKLVIEGQDTLVDKGILERLYDPLTHLVNNAIYHGIETPDVRHSLGKSVEGTIRIRAFYQGNQTVISISDDGAGIDPERVKGKAIEKGLITEGQAAQMTRSEAFALLMQPGFSTNDQADDLAGRGVGMDVVRSSILDIRGVINTDSVVGKGTTFTIRLPLTLSITKALCCSHQGLRLAFPIDGVEDVIDLNRTDLPDLTQDGSTFEWSGQNLVLKSVSDLLNHNRPIRRNGSFNSFQTQDAASIIVLRSDNDLIGLCVDEVLGEQEIVIKQLTGPIAKPLGISGVTVLGNGRVMPIADVHEMIELSLDRLEFGARPWQGMFSGSSVEEYLEPMVLIVDDSITVRELLSTTFQRAGYRVEQARDGLEAWEKLRSGLPCELVFCDVEMPRMDGFELLSRAQQDSDLHDLPFAMLTSRGATRHKQMATDLGARGYFTKPYMEEVLLDAAQRLINGEVLVK
ncbi:hybrid sensor histidine kinase/response regulator [Lyngbya confervoides]|uniref:histidine kinase n=1 Tax=Lyngbya confervoides BDU141951 TaxID=1574623 RepID=A0ABD4T9J8_9CYAN|nr:hybrid sensor histidine kinase/response regulator [Lyngbya confervoides]MCM1985184.1 hybrid sensor histidine kinase/response regulator [Lyngbya confervoides BDU141951]